MAPPQELHTPRLWLRPPRPGDADAAHTRWAGDAEVLRYLDWRPSTSLAQTRARLDWDAARWLKGSTWTWLLIEPAQDPAPIGLISLTPQRLDGPAHHLRLGYLLARAQQRRGLMFEALAALSAAVWHDPVVQRLDALCDVDNHASARLLARLGWTCEGRLHRHSLHPNAGDAPRDVWLYAAVRDSASGAGPTPKLTFTSAGGAK